MPWNACCRSWWSKDTVAVVTGGNRGLGLEIVRQLAEQGLTVVLRARDKTKGQAAADELQAKGFKTVIFHQLDASDSESVQSFATWLKNAYGGFDILINNAAVYANSFDYESAKIVLATNYYGVKKVTASLLPLLKASPAGARIVTVSARAGLYERLRSESLLHVFRDEEKYSEQVADSLAERYLADLKAGRTEEEGWVPNQPGKSAIYSESKMVLNVYSIALAKSLVKSRTEGNEILLASMCPGVTLTDMIQEAYAKGFVAPEGVLVKTVAEGAETAVWLALLPKDEWQGKTGKFFGERTEYPFGWKNLPQ